MLGRRFFPLPPPPFTHTLVLMTLISLIRSMQELTGMTSHTPLPVCCDWLTSPPLKWRLRGGGFEQKYKNCKLIFMDIPNIHGKYFFLLALFRKDVLMSFYSHKRCYGGHRETKLPVCRKALRRESLLGGKLTLLLYIDWGLTKFVLQQQKRQGRNVFGWNTIVGFWMPPFKLLTFWVHRHVQWSFTAGTFSLSLALSRVELTYSSL